jgi:hypothetical protein
MKPERIEKAINNKIKTSLVSGKSLIDVYSDLEENIKRFSNNEKFIDVSINFLKGNWEVINIKSRYISYYTLYSKKRKSDIMWLIKKKQGKFNNFSDYRIFKLMMLKELLEV